MSRYLPPPLRTHKSLNLQVFAIDADGYGTALARCDDERAGVAPARDDFGVRVDVRRGLAYGDYCERGRGRGIVSRRCTTLVYYEPRSAAVTGQSWTRAKPKLPPSSRRNLTRAT